MCDRFSLKILLMYISRVSQNVTMSKTTHAETLVQDFDRFLHSEEIAGCECLRDTDEYPTIFSVKSVDALVHLARNGNKRVDFMTLHNLSNRGRLGIKRDHDLFVGVSIPPNLRVESITLYMRGGSSTDFTPLETVFLKDIEDDLVKFFDLPIPHISMKGVELSIGVKYEKDYHPAPEHDTIGLIHSHLRNDIRERLERIQFVPVDRSDDGNLKYEDILFASEQFRSENAPTERV